MGPLCVILLTKKPTACITKLEVRWGLLSSWFIGKLLMLALLSRYPCSRAEMRLKHMVECGSETALPPGWYMVSADMLSISLVP